MTVFLPVYSARQKYIWYIIFSEVTQEQKIIPQSHENFYTDGKKMKVGYQNVSFSALFNEIIWCYSKHQNLYIFSGPLLETNLASIVSKCIFSLTMSRLQPEENLKSWYLDSHDNSLTCRETNDGNDVYIPVALFPASVAFFDVCFSSC